MTEIVLDVPLKLESGNALSGYHWRKRHRMKRDWTLALMAATRQARVVVTFARVAIVVERHAPRSVDPDNCVSALKPVLDALVGLGVLIDDRAEVVTSLTVVQVKAPRGQERTVIRLRPAAPASESSCPTSAPARPAHSPA